MWHWHGGSWGWIWIAVGMAAFWAAGKVTPDDLLAERFARGEIDVGEYEHRREVLGGRR